MDKASFLKIIREHITWLRLQGGSNNIYFMKITFIYLGCYVLYKYTSIAFTTSLIFKDNWSPIIPTIYQFGRYLQISSQLLFGQTTLFKDLLQYALITHNTRQVQRLNHVFKDSISAPLVTGQLCEDMLRHSSASSLIITDIFTL